MITTFKFIHEMQPDKAAVYTHHYTKTRRLLQLLGWIALIQNCGVKGRRAVKVDHGWKQHNELCILGSCSDHVLPPHHHESTAFSSLYI